jgi:hypothetical protein
MAKLTGPALSIVSHGPVASLITYSRSRGRNIAHHYAIPTNPRSTAQTNHRDLYASAVNSWHAYQQHPHALDAWRRAATHKRCHRTAYAHSISALVPIFRTVVDLTCYNRTVAYGNDAAIIEMIHLGTGAIEEDQSDLVIYIGDNPDSMHLLGTFGGDGGTVYVHGLGNSTRHRYITITRDGLPRSGAIRIPAASSPITPSQHPSLSSWYLATADKLTLAGSKVAEWHNQLDGLPMLWQDNDDLRPTWIPDGDGLGTITFPNAAYYLQQEEAAATTIKAMHAIYGGANTGGNNAMLDHQGDNYRRFLHLPNVLTIFDDNDNHALFKSGACSISVDGVQQFAFTASPALHSVLATRTTTCVPAGTMRLNQNHDGIWGGNFSYRSLAFFSSTLTPAWCSALDAYAASLHGVSL